MPSDLWEDAEPPPRTVYRLPLVCRRGRPTALEHLPQRSLVTFVTFLLSSLKMADDQTTAAVRQMAQMWPDIFSGVATDPSISGAAANGHTLDKSRPGRLRRLVRCWYRLLGCELLLSFSAVLEREDHRGRLRLQRNGDGTSSLYERCSERLVVTYRDCSPQYDGSPAAEESPPPPPEPSPPKSAAAASVQESPPDCEGCGAQFVTLAAAMAHERLCDGVGSDCESILSEPTARTVSQARFLSYLGVVPAAGSQNQPYQSRSVERRRARRRQRCWPTAELLLRLSRTEFSSPLGRRMLTQAVRLPTGAEEASSWSAARQDRHCCTRAQLRVPTDEFPVTWSAPASQSRLQPRVYCFTARQRAERAAAIEAGLSARAKARYYGVRPCSVVLTRLKTVNGAVRTAQRRQHHPPDAARVLLVRLSEAELATHLSGTASPPTTPPDRPAGPVGWSGGATRLHERQGLLRDECKTLRDAHFFHLLDCAERVTRGDRWVSRLNGRPPGAGGACRPRSQSEGDALEGGSAATPTGHRRMSLLGSVQDRLHGAARARARAASLSVRPQQEPKDPAEVLNGVRSEERADWSDSSRDTPPRPECSPTERDRVRRLPHAVGDLMKDECKTLRDRQFVRLLNSPRRTTRSAATERPAVERRRWPVSVWLHWPGFAREPDHQTPVKHARAAGEPRRHRVPVVRLERLFHRLERPAAGADGDGTAGSRRRLALDTPDAGLAARFVSRCKQKLLDASPVVAKHSESPPSSPSPKMARLSAGLITKASRTVKPADPCWCVGRPKRSPSRPVKTFSESMLTYGLKLDDLLLNGVCNNNIQSSPKGPSPEKRTPLRPRKARSALCLGCRRWPSRASLEPSPSQPVRTRTRFRRRTRSSGGLPVSVSRF
ncbi:uncharacterized protein LOC122379007 [Amphibalanus amphitrite]|uniref:uncharacterized protein LOC122379007 n=1 Tax=Amphibalanus amphitrite TaxID=1232801 RepID=UPI001C9225C9|nr:uncharacterized protein LOC122379007 [Amphibalanus amphitrite]